MRKHELIGFCGEMGAGKDEAGKALLALCYERAAFGDALKEMLAVGLQLSQQQLHGSPADKAARVPWLPKGVSTRRLLQTLGTEWGRDLIDPDLWVKVLARRLWNRRQMGNHTPLVITDVRFENEAQMIREAGGTVIHISRKPMKRASTARAWWNRWVLRKHPSECMPRVLPGDKVIINDGTVADLHARVRQIAFLDLGLGDYEEWLKVEEGAVARGG